MRWNVTYFLVALNTARVLRRGAYILTDFGSIKECNKRIFLASSSDTRFSPHIFHILCNCFKVDRLSRSAAEGRGAHFLLSFREDLFTKRGLL